jgi:hypothetical protein
MGDNEKCYKSDLGEIRENNDERCGKDDKCCKIVIVIMLRFSVSTKWERKPNG